MMVKQVVRYVCILVGLVGLLSTSALQYTHDTSHEHCSTANAQDKAHQKSTAADECALCWFVSHQLTPNSRLEVLLPDAATKVLQADVNEATLERYQSISPFRKSNKDPPSLV